MKRPKITIIGSGNVAFHLGLALRESGFVISQVYGRRMERARWLAGRVSADPANSLADIRQDADVYLMAVSDDAIQTLSASLRLPGKVVVHTSGATSADILAPVTAKYGVFYPLQSFKIGRKVDWTHVPLLLTGEQAVLKVLQPLAEALSTHTAVITDSQRHALHLAAVFINNFTNHCFTIAREIADAKSADFQHLIPLATHTVNQALEHDTRDLQTGPAKRGDIHTLARHREQLKDQPALLALYDAMTRHIQAYYGATTASSGHDGS